MIAARQVMIATVLPCACAVIGAVTLLTLGQTPFHAAWTAVLFALLTALAWTDARTETVPDGLTLGLVLAGLIQTALIGNPMLATISVAVLLIGVGIIQDAIAPDRGWIGSGDYFLFAGAVAWVGPVDMPDILLLMTVFLGLHAIVARRCSVALAPSLSLAVALVWLEGLIL